MESSDLIRITRDILSCMDAPPRTREEARTMLRNILVAVGCIPSEHTVTEALDALFPLTP